jgi:glycosyltransferase involved in cell wall biosynthesis
MTARPLVAHVLPFPAVGGTEIATLRVMNAAREHGIDGVAFHPVGADPVRELFDEAGFETVPYEAVPPSYRSPRAFFANSLALAREFRGRGVTLVHASDVLGALLAGYGARTARLPLICHVRNRYTDLSLRDRSFLVPVSRFVFVSRYTWDHFAARVPKRRGTVLYDGIDIPAPPSAGVGMGVRAEFGIPAEAPVIGMVARVAPQKDYPTLVTAARAVVERFPDARFVIVGDASSTPALREHYAATRQLIETAGVAANFVFTDFRTDVPRFLDAFDLFVLSTHWEGLPLVLLEAMAHGRPVVSTRVDGIPELVVHGRNGLLYDHEDAAELAAHLTALVNDRPRLLAMGQAAREHVAAGFSRAAFAGNVARVYEEVLSARPRRLRAPASTAHGSDGVPDTRRPIDKAAGAGSGRESRA